jgi:hypothetical protein
MMRAMPTPAWGVRKRPELSTRKTRAIYEKGIGQSEKHGHSGMADDLRLALIQLGERS